MKKTISLALFFFLIVASYADEGMWLLKELSDKNISRMQQLGFTFDTDKLYDENSPSLKDAVIIFGGGCTGVAVSEQGLIFTNHHCGYDAIQKHSGLEHNYLRDGFVSNSLEEEIYTEGLTVKFLQKIEDVTYRVFSDIKTFGSEAERYNYIDSISAIILKEYAENEFIDADIVPFYGGNKYYLRVYDVFRDVRMVLAPPSSIGKFGGETDNWMWPRETGDFAVFRVYADSENKPANFNPSNRPYKPIYTVPISLKGYNQGSYAMTVGYPGITDRYLPSWGIKQLIESENTPRIEVRTEKQAIWGKAMAENEEVRIKYASKFTRSSNYWKNAIGMNNALTEQDVFGRKQQQEKIFNSWLVSDDSAMQKYGEALSLLESGYTNSMEAEKIYTYFAETFFNGIEIIRFANFAIQNGIDSIDTENFEKRLAESYKNYVPEIDKKVTSSLLELYADKTIESYLPSVYETIKKEFGGDYSEYADWLFKNTHFKNIEDAVNFLETSPPEEINADPAIILAKSANKCFESVNGYANMYRHNIGKGLRLYIAGLMEMNADKSFYSDANFTQRLSYGSVKGYAPTDSTSYNYFTTTKELLQKANTGNPEYFLQQEIVDIIKQSDWESYIDKDDTMHINFLSTNDITGGNSGSPVLNGNAELIGLAFDGNWESLSGDILYDEKVQRAINVDIRYVLFVIDRIMNCRRIINELEIVS